MILWLLALLVVAFVCAAIGVTPARRHYPRQRITPNVEHLRRLSERARGKVQA